MDDAQLLRYSRHILLDGFGIEGQERLLGCHALIIGAGGLGSPAALYLAAAGVGHITLVDHDNVDLTNLQRQIAHTTARVGQSKVDSARASMAALNPEIRIDAVNTRADATLLDSLVPKADVVLDCCDNFSTRQAVNSSCVRHGKPLVSAAAIRFDAQVSVFNTRHASSPCYACVFPPSETFEESLCSTLGVFAPLLAIAGGIQAGETMKLLLDLGEVAEGRLLMLDARTMSWSEMRVLRNANCPVCATRALPPSLAG